MAQVFPLVVQLNLTLSGNYFVNRRGESAVAALVGPDVSGEDLDLRQAGRNEELVGEPDLVAESTAALVAELLERIDR